jgi:Flp pilus assembly protein TadD
MSRARARAERAARLAPGSADAHALAGIAAANQGDFAAARQQLGRALAIDPHNRDAATAMAQLDRQSPAP